MKRMMRRIMWVGAIVLMGVGVQQLMAQEQQQRQRPDRQNFDPAQMQQRMMERYKESLEVTSEDEWKIIQERIQKVNEARRDVGFGGGRGMFGGMRPGGNNPPGDQGQGGGRRGFGGEPNAAMQELQQAVESKATAEQLKAKLAKVRDDRKQKQAKLEQAQEELKKVLNVRREAIAVTMGLLN